MTLICLGYCICLSAAHCISEGVSGIVLYMFDFNFFDVESPRCRFASLLTTPRCAVPPLRSVDVTAQTAYETASRRTHAKIQAGLKT